MHSRPYRKAWGGGKTLTLQLDYHHAGEAAHTRTAAEEEARPFHLVWSPDRPDVRANVLVVLRTAAGTGA